VDDRRADARGGARVFHLQPTLPLPSRGESDRFPSDRRPPRARAAGKESDAISTARAGAMTAPFSFCSRDKRLDHVGSRWAGPSCDRNTNTKRKERERGEDREDMVSLVGLGWDQKRVDRVSLAWEVIRIGGDSRRERAGTDRVGGERGKESV